MSWIYEQWYLIDTFIKSGGPVLLAIALLLLLLWGLMIERVYYLLVLFPVYQQKVVNKWCCRDDKKSWFALQIRQGKLARASLLLKQNMSFLNALIKMFPLLGLLGTVSGMIQVFDVVAVHGTGNPRLLASGISLATIPTMAGLVCALSGLFIYSRLDSHAKKLHAGLALQLVSHQDEKLK
ncbi:MotA/TolQ/ExbB proton channel family protein [Psychromonas sp. Urea-02u-13]|uniref:MotA/TolQ/ExbB proton channel family protein n=1 Tax=Psychromonas sp. Urea-02u-13 TaxID=2058326 RepID=UPI000C32F80D|nr:MotA/TolQ/ExbB proton channel family protein [Psychromonas sp. Urea-02u-13]PKG39230.1 biopolymer transporter ExbB [Psychromonas sp. Urea-02u-13]